MQMQQALQALAPKPRRKGAGGGVTVSGAAACHVRVPAATAAQLTSLAPQSWRLLHVLQDKEKRKPGKTRVSSQTAALNAALAARRAAAGDTPARQPLAQVQNLPAQPEGGLGVLAEAAAGQENQDPLLPAVRPPALLPMPAPPALMGLGLLLGSSPLATSFGGAAAAAAAGRSPHGLPDGSPPATSPGGAAGPGRRSSVRQPSRLGPQQGTPAAVAAAPPLSLAGHYDTAPADEKAALRQRIIQGNIRNRQPSSAFASSADSDGHKRTLAQRHVEMVRAAGGDLWGQLVHYSLPRLIREHLRAAAGGRLPSAAIPLLQQLVQQLVDVFCDGAQLQRQLAPLAAAVLKGRLGLTDAQWSELQRTATALPTLHHVRAALRGNVPELADLEGLEDGCILANPLELVQRELAALYAEHPFAAGAVVELSHGLDGHSIELANGDKRTMTQLNCSVNGIGGWVPDTALSSSRALPVGYAVSKEEAAFAALLGPWQQALWGLPGESCVLEGANGTTGIVYRYPLEVPTADGASERLRWEMQPCPPSLAS